MSILDEKYVSLVTLRKTGVPVASPIWIVKVDDKTGAFYSDLDAGKMKRIRNNPNVTLQACTLRGMIKPNSPVVHGTAAVVDGPAAESVRALLNRKYSIITKLMAAGNAALKLFRRPVSATCCVHVTLAD